LCKPDLFTGTRIRNGCPPGTSDAKIDGKVVSVDVTARIVVVRTGEAGDTFTVQSGAKIMLGMMELSKETTLGDLMPDSRVTLTWK